MAIRVVEKTTVEKITHYECDILKKKIGKEDIFKTLGQKQIVSKEAADLLPAFIVENNGFLRVVLFAACKMSDQFCPEILSCGIWVMWPGVITRCTCPSAGNNQRIDPPLEKLITTLAQAADLCNRVMTAKVNADQFWIIKDGVIVKHLVVRRAALESPWPPAAPNKKE